MYRLFIGVYVFSSVREHLLSSLLSLEFMVLRIFLFFILSIEIVGGYYSLVYLIMAACEGALGLSILIIMSRRYGGDYFRGVGLFII